MAISAVTTSAPASPPALSLTPKGERYALAHARPAGCPPGLDPQLWRQGVESRIERHLALVSALVAMLDVMEGDPDLETDDPDLEPSLGGYSSGTFGVEDVELDTADSEPSLGAPEPFYEIAPYWNHIWPTERLIESTPPQGSQASWARGHGADAEIDIQDEPHDGELDEREGDGLEHGEADHAEGDSGEIIPGGGYHL